MPEPVEAVPADPPAAAEEDALKAALRRAGACEGTPDIHEVQTVRLDDGREVYEVTCFLAAYQAAVQYVLADGLRPVRWESGEPLYIGGLPTLHPDGRLEWLSKARGLGDCGSTYQTRLSGSVVVLEQERHRDCGDDPHVPPEEWTVWDRGHCAMDEVVWFTCPVAGGRDLSVCGRWGEAQYRFGAKGEPDLIHPKEPSDRVFELAESSDHGERLSFTREGMTYEIRTRSEEQPRGAVTVREAGKPLAQIPCSGEVRSRLGELRGLRAP